MLRGFKMKSVKKKETTESRYAVQFPNDFKPEFVKLAQVFGYNEPSQAARNAAKVGLRIFKEDPQLFLKYLS